ncbi:hypothetical protein B0H15DRAFT_129066 [Mycena belliarum]|uniref:Uncharacterized protein n=1 Tax=Mycena belliarum TaxID=1033014 RepID=A0AAD6U8V8_9AGAR|nr:hypothetical protein B0H15DRAFT_129066 [Mycena belliae]
MSSSPPQLHLSLPPNTTSFKRSFEQFGFDLESPSGPRAHDSIDGTSTSASGQSSSSTSPDGDENRRKRARSAGSLSDPEDRSSEESSSTLSSFHSEPSSADSHLSHQTSSQAAARRHLLLDLGLGRGLGSSVALGLSMASAELQLGGGRATEPPPRIPTPDLLESDDIEMPDIDMDFSHSEEHEDRQTSHAEHVRRSVDRFNTFDRHISVLRSSSPPVIPLPASLSSRQASQSPPTLPPLPLVDLGLDADDNNHDNNLSTQITTTTTNTPPRLNLNLPPTTSLSSVPSSPSAARDASSSSSSAQFRERLDSAIDGLGGGDLHFEAPITYNSTSDRFEQRTDDGPMSDRYLEPVQDSSGPSTSNIAARTRLLVETPLSEWPPVIDWDVTLGRPGSSSEAMQPLRSPTFSSWRPRVRPTSATAATNTTNADIRRFIGNSYSPPPHPPPPTRLYPRPVSLAAPLSVQATTSGEAAALDADLVDAYLDFQRSNTNTRAWESALERARTLRQEREQERERIRATDRERERARANQREREEEETDRELEHPWSLDSIWETNARGESYSSSARPRPRDSLTLRARREFMEDNGRELELELSRRRALQRQMHRASDTDRERQLEEQHERGQSSVSRAARYLESGLLDPREASRPMPLPSGREQRSPPDTANPFAITWAPNRGASTGDEEASSSTHRFRSSSHSRESGVNRIPRTEQDEDHGMEAFAEWFNSVPPTYRIANPRTTEPSGEGVDFLRGGGGEPPGSGEWRARTAGAWQPRLAVSRQSTAVPTRTATHARAQSIPISSLSPSLSSLNSVPPRPSLHRLRSRLHGPPRAAGVGSTNSLVAENAAAIRRREARTEFMERLNRTITHDVDDLSDPESDWEPRMRQPARDPPRLDMDLDSDEDHLSLPRRIAEAIDLIGSRPPLRISHRRSDSSPTRSSRPSIGRALFDQDTDEQPTASSSGLNSRRPSSSIHPRRTIPRLRQHHVSGEISPPPQPSAVVDRHHASWEAPSRDTDVSSTYQYLSNLSHGFDSQSVSISDMAHTITSNSETAEDTRRIPPSPPWGETESPFSTLFSRSPRSPSSPAPQRHARYSRPQDMPGRYPDDVMEAIEDPSVPSLPPPDLGRNFERAEDVLRSAHGSRHPPPFSNFTGPFRLTMQRREEFRAARAAAAAMSPQRIPEPPSIPPLYFGGEFEGSSMQGPSEEGSARSFSSDFLHS